MSRGEIVAIPQVGGLHPGMKDAPRESRGHQAHPQSISPCPKPTLFLDWLHAADSTSSDLTLQELVPEPTIYLIPEFETPERIADVVHELCEGIFVEQLTGWFHDTTTWPPDHSFDVFCRWFD
jgi:hypothetical protein